MSVCILWVCFCQYFHIDWQKHIHILSVLFICVGVLLSVIGCIFVRNVYLSGCVFVRTVVLLSYITYLRNIFYMIWQHPWNTNWQKHNYQTDKSTTGVFLPVVLLQGSHKKCHQISVVFNIPLKGEGEKKSHFSILNKSCARLRIEYLNFIFIQWYY